VTIEQGRPSRAAQHAGERRIRYVLKDGRRARNCGGTSVAVYASDTEAGPRGAIARIATRPAELHRSGATRMTRSGLSGPASAGPLPAGLSEGSAGRRMRRSGTEPANARRLSAAPAFGPAPASPRHRHAGAAAALTPHPGALEVGRSPAAVHRARFRSVRIKREGYCGDWDTIQNSDEGSVWCPKNSTQGRPG